MGKEVTFKNHDRFIHLGIAIAALRKMRGMSQEQLAERKKAGLGIEASNSHATFGHNPMRFAWGFDEETDECREAMRPYAHCRFRMI